ncbi:hypothetical protein VNO77_44004 [Canavalia gladiata]|uniref:Uncharacterized protein n=1 Tax=Canavalia gladiata TaxID=3824 RepID=A0AAN9JYU3_CANGL
MCVIDLSESNCWSRRIEGSKTNGQRGSFLRQTYIYANKISANKVMEVINFEADLEKGKCGRYGSNPEPNLQEHSINQSNSSGLMIQIKCAKYVLWVSKGGPWGLKANTLTIAPSARLWLMISAFGLIPAHFAWPAWLHFVANILAIGPCYIPTSHNIQGKGYEQFEPAKWLEQLGRSVCSSNWMYGAYTIMASNQGTRQPGCCHVNGPSGFWN